MVTIQPPQTGLSSQCAPILRALPAWFGIEASTQQYIHDIDIYPTLLAVENGHALGFLTLVEHTPYAAEIHGMGVLPTHHRHGVGRALVGAAEAYLRGRRVEFLQVKTLSAKHPDEGYGKTRAFYLSMGFRPLEEFPDLWGRKTPACNSSSRYNLKSKVITCPSCLHNSSQFCSPDPANLLSFMGLNYGR